jgi:hypothetical protein
MDCTSLTGSSTLAPGYPKLVPAATYTANDTNDNLEKNQVITSSGTIGGCTGHPGITGGTFSNSVITTHDPSDCNELASIGDTSDGTTLDAPPPSGNLHIVWSNGQTSDSTVKLLPVAGSATTLRIKGHGTAGLFAGTNSKVKVSFTVGTGQCVGSDFTSATFTNSGTGTNLEID